MILKKENIIPAVILAVILVFFGVIFSLISLVNHYEFRTYALDLGMFNQAMYSFAHLHLNYFTLIPNGVEINYFADHFSPITALYAPLSFLLGTYTLLILQIAAILFGGFGAYLFARHQLDSKYLPLIILVQFFCIWGIYSALAFDFHNNVIGAMLVPWLVYFYVKDSRKLLILFFVLILLTKENMAIWLIFIMLGLMFMKGLRNWRKYFRLEIPLIISALVYLVVVVGSIMPALNDGKVLQLDRYTPAGSSLWSRTTNIITDPRLAYTTIFENQALGQDFADDKTQLHAMVLTSGGAAFLLAPWYLFMLIPIYLQKFLSLDPTFWGIGRQYSIEFVPMISLALTTALIKLRLRKIQYPVAILITLMTFISLYTTINDRTKTMGFVDNVLPFSEQHYQRPAYLPKVYEELDQIPEDASLSVSSQLSPHLSLRDKIYLYPIIKDAEYVVLLQDKQDNILNFKSLPESKDFKPMFQTDNFWIYKRTT